VSARDVRAFLQRHELLARRDLGQNFLCDEGLAARLTGLAGVEPEDTVIEIGTGLGLLTCALASQARRVVTLEVDAGLVRALGAEHVLPAGVELIHADVLRFDLAGLVGAASGPVRVVANLPYSISAPVLRRLLDLRHALVGWSVMLQREVADRLLTVLHRLTVEIGKSLSLSPGCFYPVPRVRSTFLRMLPLADAPLAEGELDSVERFVRAAFSQRRKTLVNALRGGELDPTPDPRAVEALLVRLGFDPRARAESLAPQQLLDLARELTREGAGSP
jgi:16S rRNA (adenine1518-N6/adenine1519-N6)-dimethyltransferase